MIIESINVTGFRNLETYKTSFSKNRNLIYGQNGAGKTSLLEAVFLLAFAKSFLNRKKSDLVNHGRDEFIIRLQCSSRCGTSLVSAHYDNRLTLFLNDKKTTIFEINRCLYPVFFSSSDYNLYIENIPYTRKLIDRFIFGVNSLYIRCILSYNKALKQKNHLLKTTQNLSELSSWNRIISEVAEKIVSIKIKFIERLNIETRSKFNKDLSVEYHPSFKVDKGISADIFYTQLQSQQSRELKYQRSFLGPHLDGCEFRLNSQPLKLFSSGEKKIHLLMIYISFIELFKGVKEEYPVFLLDDFDTAIDTGNIDFLMKSYPEMQVIATSVTQNPGFDRLIELIKEN